MGFDSPADAIGCAVAIQRRLDQQRREHGFAPQVRIGVHHASAQQVEGNYRGNGVHEAARIAAVAKGSEIIASRDTAEGDGFRHVGAAVGRAQGPLGADGRGLGRLEVSYPPPLFTGDEAEVSATVRRVGAPPDLVYPNGTRVGYLATGGLDGRAVRTVPLGDERGCERARAALPPSRSPSRSTCWRVDRRSSTGASGW